MNELLSSIKSDLLDRRMLPLLAVFGAALVAAVAYAVLGGGSSAPAQLTASAPTQRSGGIAVMPVAANPAKVVAETINGASSQQRGVARNPFVSLPFPKAASAASKAAASSSSSSSSASTKSSSSSSSESQTTPSKPAAPAKPRTVYHVTVAFGVPPAGAAPLTATLESHSDLKLNTPLPSAKTALVSFREVASGGKAAVFTLVGEAIIRGNAACRPSASLCQALELKPGQYEQLEYFPPSGLPPVTYELRVTSIEAATA